MNDSSKLLAPWANFYVMTGSSAATLTGLMFVVITLVTGEGRARRSREGTSNFSTPTVIHLTMALLVSAVASAPWPSLRYPCIVLGIAGLFGIGYIVRVAMRIRAMESYSADTEDWVWHTLLPCCAYIAIAAGAGLLGIVPQVAAAALFLIASAVVLLLFVGIHNAWDIVTYIAIDLPTQQPNPKDSNQSS